MKLSQMAMGLSFIFALSSCFSQDARGEKLVMEKPDGLYANIVTNKGDILVKLEMEKSPLTTLNFVGLAEGVLNSSTKKGPFYEGIIFHRVVPNFVVQGGDPTGTGTSGPGYSFPDEIDPSLKHDKAGILSMANSGPNTNGSQFFITLEPTPWLDGKHAIFGEVVEGMDVVKKIAQEDNIQRVEIIAKGEKAEAFEISQKHFDELLKEVTKEQKKSQETFLKSQEEKALARFKNKPSQTPEGIFYEIEKEGQGTPPKSGQKVEVHYAGYLLSGDKFDSSYDRGDTFSFTLDVDRLIPGWESQLKEMKVGEKRHIVIPPHLAYGERGVPGVIPPNSFLDFTVELISVK